MTHFRQYILHTDNVTRPLLIYLGLHVRYLVFVILSLLPLFSPDLMRMIFSRVQSCLRKHVNRKTAPESRLRQFMSTSIHSVGSSTEVIVQMERASDVSVQVRGPRSEDRQCFFLLEEVLGVIDQVG